MSHSDPVQTRGFKAELNLEIRQFICDKLNKLEEYTSISLPQPSNDSDTTSLTSVNLKLFGDEPYLAELLASCVKLRKKNVELTRRSAALTFRKSRLNVEVSCQQGTSE
uniref:Spindle and kinetochore-associated protein 3 n=1 Tax=Panagrellus redivivus TaxID=6233 RepID=A0A7E4V183_PANRE